MSEFKIYANVFKSTSEYLDLKRNLITEAINFPTGTYESQKHITINKYKNIEAFFLKPGKESIRKTENININDMFPCVSNSGEIVTNKWKFSDIWEYLIKISLIQKDAFKKVLTLLYRLCYFCDYNNNRLSYSDELIKEICNVEKYILIPGFREKFKTKEISILEFLYFVDLLGWNEDVKYLGKNKFPYFNNYTESKKGRTNTINSIITAPILISKFVDEVIYKTKNNKTIDVTLTTNVVQQFSKQGVMSLKKDDLIKYLSPYLEEVNDEK